MSSGVEETIDKPAAAGGGYGGIPRGVAVALIANRGRAGFVGWIGSVSEHCARAPRPTITSG